MPSIARITSTFFVTLINRLGVRPPPDEGFLLSNVVQPVSIVDTDVALTATTSTPLMNTAFTEGEQAAAAADILLADTGAQTIGTYIAVVLLGTDDNNLVRGVRLQRRDAANAASVWSSYQCIVSNNVMLILKITLLASERLRVVNGPNAMGAGTLTQASIFLVAA